MKKPLISVIVPVYNTEKYLPKCIESIIGQTYKNLEIILVDDGSTDTSGKICDEYAKKDSRIIVLHKKNGGQSSARNAGIEAARGKYLNLIDSDDEVAPSFIEELYNKYKEDVSVVVCGTLYKRLRQNTENAVYTNAIRKRRKNETKAAYLIHNLTVDGRMYSSLNKLYRMDVIRKNNLRFDEGRNFAEDTKFVIEYLKHADGEIAFVLKPLYIYNFGTSNSTIRKTSTVWKNWKKSYEDLKSYISGKPNLEERFWLMAVLARWRVSYIRSKRRLKTGN